MIAEIDTSNSIENLKKATRHVLEAIENDKNPVVISTRFSNLYDLWDSSEEGIDGWAKPLMKGSREEVTYLPFGTSTEEIYQQMSRVLGGLLSIEPDQPEIYSRL